MGHAAEAQKANHWSEVDRNPLSTASRNFVRERLRSAYRGRFGSYLDVIERFVRGKNVLDIGVVEHVREYIERPDWKHRIISKTALRAIGCDILAPEVEYLRSQGFDVRLIDATSDGDMGERFELAYIGDVIEHVNDPIKLVSFAARHVGVGGRVVVTTPCPFWYKHSIACLRERPFIGNVDHVRWITPADALEIGHRASVELEEYYLVQNLGHGPLSKIAHLLRTCVGLGDSELFSWAYVYVFEKASEATKR